MYKKGSILTALVFLTFVLAVAPAHASSVSLWSRHNITVNVSNYDTHASSAITDGGMTIFVEGSAWYNPSEGDSDEFDDFLAPGTSSAQLSAGTWLNTTSYSVNYNGTNGFTIIQDFQGTAPSPFEGNPGGVDQYGYSDIGLYYTVLTAGSYLVEVTDSYTVNYGVQQGEGNTFTDLYAYSAIGFTAEGDTGANYMLREILNNDSMPSSFSRDRTTSFSLVLDDLSEGSEIYVGLYHDAGYEGNAVPLPPSLYLMGVGLFWLLCHRRGSKKVLV